MTQQKSERLLSLLIMLLVQRRPVSKDRIRELVYPGLTRDAFERKFDRDKEELRSLGVPIEVGPIDSFFEDEVGYRIPHDEFALPDISLTADEAAVVALAARVWQNAGLADATAEALRKLVAAGIDLDPSALDIAQPSVIGDEPSFDAFWRAASSRTPVTFDYQRVGRAPQIRRLQPWGLTRYSGRWYVVGFDLDRDDERVFRLSRVVGEVRTAGRPGSYDVPPGTDVRETARRLAPPSVSEPVVLLVRPGAGAPLRRRAVSVESGVTGPDGETWDRIEVLGVAPDEVLALGPGVVVEQPRTLRDEVVARLRAVVG